MVFVSFARPPSGRRCTAAGSSIIAIDSLALRRVLHALVATAGAMLPTACTPGPPGLPDAKLKVTSTQQTGTYQLGDDISFWVVATNAGDNDVGSLSIATTFDANVLEKSCWHKKVFG
jgi:hypothetical protein